MRSHLNFRHAVSKVVWQICELSCKENVIIRRDLHHKHMFESLLLISWYHLLLNRLAHWDDVNEFWMMIVFIMLEHIFQTWLNNIFRWSMTLDWSTTYPKFDLVTSRSWQYISCCWDACSNHSAISDFSYFYLFYPNRPRWLTPSTILLKALKVCFLHIK